MVENPFKLGNTDRYPALIDEQEEINIKGNTDRYPIEFLESDSVKSKTNLWIDELIWDDSELWIDN